MRVTVITDASYCPEYKVAGYGFWIACERGKQGGGGQMKTTVENNIIAEMQAVANSLYQAVRLGLVQQGDEVLLQTDCIPAIDAFTMKRTKLISAEHEVIRVLTNIQTNYFLTLEFRHVKGHTDKQGARYITNKLCDKRAKDAMRKARDHVRIQQLKEILK